MKIRPHKIASVVSRLHLPAEVTYSLRVESRSGQVLVVRALEGRTDTRARVAIGRQVAHLATLRAMSISVAGLLEAGENPALEASVVKDVGGVFEQDLPGIAQSLVDRPPAVGGSGDDFQNVLAELMQNAPSFSLRGGTREILRGIIARGLGLR